MEKITLLTRKNLPDVRAHLERALKLVETETGLKVKVGHCTYSDLNCTFKVEVDVVDNDGTVNSKSRTDFLNLCDLYNLKKEHLEATFRTSRGTYKIIGLMPRKRRCPILAVNVANPKDQRLFDAITVSQLVDPKPGVAK